MHTALVYMNIWVFMLILSIQAYSHNEHGCLTWDIRSNRLILTCRLKHFSIPVSVIDNHEQEYIKCTLKGKINNCISPHTSKSVLINNSINTITLTIRKINESNVDGKWRCKQGKHYYETEVSTSKGIISATDIHLNGELVHTGTAKKVKLKCYSCREPRKNYIEFLINGSTVDGISYNKTMNKCSHRDGECKYNACACHRAGTEFIRIFTVTSVYGTQFSCDMRFNDKDKESIFSMERSLYINDTVFYNDSTIKLIKPPARGNNKKIKTEHTALVGKWIGISVSLLFTVLVLLIIFFVLPTTIKQEKSDDKTVDNIYSKDKLRYIESTLSDNIKQNTMNDSKPYNEVGETETSEYISFEKFVKTNLDEPHAEAQEADDISESTTQHTDTDFNLEEGTETERNFAPNQTTSDSQNDRHTQPDADERKHDRSNYNLEAQTKSLEKKTDEGIIQELKERVRELCSKHNPSESLILLTLDELVKFSKKLEPTKANFYVELARQANTQYSKLDISSLCLSVLDEESVDTITKTISKCLKENLKQSDNTVDGNTVGGGDGAPTRVGSPSGCVSPTFQTPHRMSYQATDHN